MEEQLNQQNLPMGERAMTEEELAQAEAELNAEETEETEEVEVPVYKNDSDNAFCRMFCVNEENWRLLNTHKINLEQLFYDYYQKFLGAPLWSVKSEVRPVASLSEGFSPFYNDYVKACKELQEKWPDEVLHGVNLTFDMDTSG